MIQKPNLEFNPFLICERHFDGGDESPKGNIEVLGASENIVHQTRASLPTPYEDRLGDVLEHLFGEGVTELPELIGASVWKWWFWYPLIIPWLNLSLSWRKGYPTAFTL